MKRLAGLTLLMVLFLSFVSGALAQTEHPAAQGEATLYYQGHGSVRITTREDKTIYIDPYTGDGYDLPADLILVTHNHSDHTNTKLIKNKSAGCVVITWKEALKGGSHQVFDLGFVTVEAVEAGYNKNHNVKSCVGYLLTFPEGTSVYLSGDTSRTPQMEELTLRQVDYAFFCCDGVYNMDVKEASVCAALVNARVSIPYHAAPGKAYDPAIAEQFSAEGRVLLRDGEELVLTGPSE